MFGQFWAGNHLAWSPVMFVPSEMAAGDQRQEAVAKKEINELVVMQTRGPRLSECFVLQRRQCYWSILDVSGGHH